MLIAVDFDGCLVEDDRDYEDLVTPLELKPGAREALYAMRRAGHTLILCSSRSNLALRQDWRLNPLWRLAIVPFSLHRWEQSLQTNQRRFEQMVTFVNASLPDVFACIDDGTQGKVSADLYIDDKALRYGELLTWEEIGHSYGIPAAG